MRHLKQTINNLDRWMPKIVKRYYGDKEPVVFDDSETVKKILVKQFGVTHVRDAAFMYALTLKKGLSYKAKLVALTMEQTGIEI